MMFVSYIFAVLISVFVFFGNAHCLELIYPEDGTYVVLDIKDFKPAENQYLLYLKGEAKTDKGTVLLKDVTGDNMGSIWVKISNEQGSEDVRIFEGESEEKFGVKVTNVFPRARAISYEKYALIQVE